LRKHKGTTVSEEGINKAPVAYIHTKRNIGKAFEKKVSKQSDISARVSEIQRRRIIHTQDTTNIGFIDQDKIDFNRGLELAQPHLFPIQQEYPWQHQGNLARADRREALLTEAIEMSDNDTYIAPEIFSLAAIEYPLLKSQHITPFLSESENEILAFIHNLEENGGELQDYFKPAANVLFLHVFEELSDIREELINGTRNIACEKTRERVEDVYEFLRPTFTYMPQLAVHVLVEAQEIAKIIDLETNHNALSFLNLTRDKDFSIQNVPAILKAYDIPVTEQTQAACKLILEESRYYNGDTDALKICALTALGTTKMLRYHYPNIDEKIITFSLVESSLRTQDQDGNTALNMNFFEKASAKLGGEIMNQFLYWTTSATTQENHFQSTPEYREHLEAFYTCKKIMHLHEYEALIDAGEDDNPVVQQTAEYAKDLATQFSVSSGVVPSLVYDAQATKHHIIQRAEEIKTTVAPL